MELKIIITALIGLILLGVTVKNYRWGLYLFIFLCPIIPPAIALYINESIPLITFQRTMLLILSGVWLVKYLMGRISKIEKPPLIELILIFVGLVFISSIFATHPKLALKEFSSERWIGIPVLYFLAFQIIRDKDTIKHIVRLLIISALVVGIIGIVEFLTHNNIFYYVGSYLMPQEKLKALGFSNNLFSDNQFLRMGIRGISSSFPIFTGLAAYVVFIVPLAMTMFSPMRMALGVSVLLTTLFLTISLGGYIIIGLVLVMIWQTKNIVRIRAFIFYIILIILLFRFTSYHVSDPNSSSIVATNVPVLAKEGGGARFWQGIAVLKTSLKHPVLGTGLGTFNEVIDVRNSEGVLLRKGDGYSYQQNVLAETGIPVFLVMLIFWLLVLFKIKETVKNFCEHNNLLWYAFTRSLFAAIIGNLILSTVSISLLNTYNGFIIFWLGIAIAMRLWVISKKDVISQSANNTDS